MTIALYEKVNRVKLNQVLECDNIPFKAESKQVWIDGFLKGLSKYKNKKYDKKGIKTIYEQKNNYGRFTTSCGLQNFQKDVRMYISGEFYWDLDFKKCHPKILENLFEKYDIRDDPKLSEFINNPDEFFKKYKLTKTDMIKLINNQDLKNINFKDFHEKIYKTLVPKLKEENKVLFNRKKKERIKQGKEYNLDGSFFSTYLQNIENNALMIMFDYLNDKGYIVGSLMFDGCYVKKTDNDISLEFENIEKLIKEQIGFDFKIVQKSTVTEWVPNKALKEEKQIEDVEEFSIEKWVGLSDVTDVDENGVQSINQEKLSEFIDYTNNFVCLFEKPHCYGWRDRITEDFDMRDSSKIVDRTSKEIGLWKKSDTKLKYKRAIFLVNEKAKELEGNYNKYIRPNMKQFEGNIEDKCSLFFDFLRRVVCDNDEDKYNYLLHLNAKIVQVGHSEQLLVLMGKKGTGKSSYVDIISELNGRDYSQVVNNIGEISNNFNALFEKSIITSIEEIVNNAGDYHAVQSKLKSLVTEKYIKITPKGIDSYMSITNNNFILCTNEFNPVKITEDNRRNCIIKLSNCELANGAYFKKLKEQTFENIEYLRYFFYTFKFNSDLNNIRPTTKEELDMLDLNRQPIEIFINEEMKLTGDNKDSSRIYSRVFEHFKEFCKIHNYKTVSAKYFTNALKQFGFSTEQKGKNKITYIIGETNNIELISDSEEDEFM